MSQIIGSGGGGSKGGGGSGSSPEEDPNDLWSLSIAKVHDVISEGEIGGLVNGLQSVFLNETPLEDSSGDFNFDNAVVEIRFGTPDQNPLGRLSDIENTVSVDAPVTKDDAVIRQVNDPNATSIRLTWRFPSMFVSQDDGDIRRTSVKIGMDIRNVDGNWERIPFGTRWSSSSNPDTTGLKITARTTGRARTSGRIRVRYRKIGTSNWKTLSRSVYFESALTYDEHYYGDPVYGHYSYQYLYEEVTRSTTFTETPLSSGEYEVEALSGTTLTKVQYRVPDDKTVSGKTMTPYERSFAFEIPDWIEHPFEIRARRVSPDDSSGKKQNDTSLAFITTIQEHKLIYPDTAYVGVSADAEVFGGQVPRRAYEIYGILCDIPSNYNPFTREYNGIWDGEFVKGWTDNPAWVLYDIITNNRYGLGDFVNTDQVDKWSLYEIAQHCDEEVPDGFGGMEPRYTFNGVINSREEAYRVLQSIASVFHGMMYWSSGTVTSVADKAEDPVKIVTPADVINGEFNYSGTALKARHSVALVTWNDPSNNYDSNITVVQDADLVQKWGWRETEITAYGCTRPGQAYRHGAWILDTNKNETETVTYQASYDHMDAMPGQIVLVADPGYMGVRYGGRVRSIDLDGVFHPNEDPDHTVLLDGILDLQENEEYTLTVVMEDGSLEEKNILDWNNTDDGTAVSIDSAFSQYVVPGAMWVISGSDAEPRPFRIISVRETESNIFEVTALFHDVTKYARIEQELTLEPPDYTAIPTGRLGAPREIDHEEYLKRSGTSVLSGVVLSWRPPQDSRVERYQVQMRNNDNDDEGWENAGSTIGNNIEIDNVFPGNYSFRVRSDTLSTLRSVWVYYENKDILGKTAPPENVQNFQAHMEDTGVEFSWDEVSDIDIRHYELRQGTVWGSGVLIGETKSDRHFWRARLHGQYNVMIKAVDELGNESDEPTLVTFTVNLPEAPEVSYHFESENLVLEWEDVASDHAIDTYEVREGQDRESATVVARTKSTSYSREVTWTDERRYWVVAIDMAGNESPDDAVSYVDVIFEPANNVTSLLGEIVDKSVRLSWISAIVGSLPIDYYSIRQGDTFENATEIAITTDNYITYFEPTADTHTFWVVPIDIGGFEGDENSATVEIVGPKNLEINYAYDGQSVVLTWSAERGTFRIQEYTIKHGSSWAAGTTINTIASTSLTLPVEWLGDRRFWITAYDEEGNSSDPADINVENIPPSVGSLEANIIDNNILLTWSSTKGSLPIQEYRVSGVNTEFGSTFADADPVGVSDTTFTNIFETVAGTFKYFIVPIDTAGNEGNPKSLTTKVEEPPDFVLRNKFFSDWIGKRENFERTVTDRTSLEFDGTGYVDVPVEESDSLDLQSNMSMEIRVYPFQEEGSDQWIVCKNDTGDVADTQYGFYIDQNTMYAVLGGNDFSIALAEDDIWSHFAFTWDGTTVTVYKNGQQENSYSFSGTVSYKPNLRFARRASSPGDGFIGRIDEIRIWDTDLTSTQINDRYTYELEGQETNLVGYWRLNERDGEVANGLSPEDHDGNIINGVWHVPQTTAVTPFPTTETVGDKLDIHGYATPQEQIDDGYPYVCQPVPGTSYIEAVYDAGVVIPGTKIIIDINILEEVVGAGFGYTIYTKEAFDDSWVEQGTVSEVYATEFRYVKIRLDFFSDGYGFYELEELITTLRTKLRTDAGTVDVTQNPTNVSFERDFIDIVSITVTPKSATEKTAIYDFLDEPFPTNFDVYLFDDQGNPITGEVSWQARGF